MTASREPQKLDEHNWYYEDRTHMLLIHEVRSHQGVHIRTDSIKVPWRKVKASLARAYKPRKRVGRQ